MREKKSFNEAVISDYLTNFMPDMVGSLQGTRFSGLFTKSSGRRKAAHNSATSERGPSSQQDPQSHTSGTAQTSEYPATHLIHFHRRFISGSSSHLILDHYSCPLPYRYFLLKSITHTLISQSSQHNVVQNVNVTPRCDCSKGLHHIT